MEQKTPSPTEGKPPKKKVRKLTDRQFLAILRENAGIYARTARAITEKYEIKFTRQSVRGRALKFPDELTDIEEENLDVAEEGLQDLMRSKNQQIKLKSIDLFLKSKGKLRGYGDNLDITSGNKPIEPFSGVLPIYKPDKDKDKE